MGADFSLIHGNYDNRQSGDVHEVRIGLGFSQTIKGLAQIGIGRCDCSFPSRSTRDHSYYLGFGRREGATL